MEDKLRKVFDKIQVSEKTAVRVEDMIYRQMHARGGVKRKQRKADENNGESVYIIEMPGRRSAGIKRLALVLSLSLVIAAGMYGIERSVKNSAVNPAAEITPLPDNKEQIEIKDAVNLKEALEILSGSDYLQDMKMTVGLQMDKGTEENAYIFADKRDHMLSERENSRFLEGLGKAAITEVKEGMLSLNQEEYDRHYMWTIDSPSGKAVLHIYRVQDKILASFGPEPAVYFIVDGTDVLDQLVLDQMEQYEKVMESLTEIETDLKDPVGIGEIGAEKYYGVHKSEEGYPVMEVLQVSGVELVEGYTDEFVIRVELDNTSVEMKIKKAGYELYQITDIGEGLKVSDYARVRQAGKEKMDSFLKTEEGKAYADFAADFEYALFHQDSGALKEVLARPDQAEMYCEYGWKREEKPFYLKSLDYDPKEGRVSAVYELCLLGEDSLSYMDITAIWADGQWKLDEIWFEK